MRVDPLQILTKLAAVQNIPTRRVTPPFEGLEEFDYGLRRSLDPQFDWQEFGQLLLDSTPENTLLLVEGTFELHFALFRIPDEKNTVFLIGPWTVGPRTPSARKWVRRYLGEAGEAAVQEYYNGVKILEASDFYGALRVVVDTMFGCTVPVQELRNSCPSNSTRIPAISTSRSSRRRSRSPCWSSGMNREPQSGRGGPGR